MDKLSILVTALTDIDSKVKKNQETNESTIEQLQKIQREIDYIVKEEVPNVIITSESNPELMAYMYEKGYAKDENKMTLEEARKVTSLNGFKDSEVKFFDEFRYFTGIKNIPTKWLNPNYSVQTITLPYTIEEIDANAFYQAHNLRRINIPKGVKSTRPKIGYNDICYIDIEDVLSFCNMGGVESTAYILLQNGVSLSDLVIPVEVANIPDSVFEKYQNIKNVYFHEFVKTIGIKSFSGCGIEKIVTYSYISEVGADAFNSCQSLKFVSIGFAAPGVIGGSAFSHCSNLEHVEIRYNSIHIQSKAFYNNTSLKEVIIYKTPYSIGDEAFGNCTSVEVYNFSHWDGVPELGSDVFIGIPENAKIIVADIVYDSFIEDANWGVYSSHIVKASEYVEPTNE